MVEKYNDGFGNNVSAMDAERYEKEAVKERIEKIKQDVKDLINEKRYADAEALCRIKSLDITAINEEVELTS